MKRSIIVLIVSLLSLASFAQMSDSQVIEYVKSEHAKGTNQQAIGAALLQKGVTQDQLKRIKSQVEKENQQESATIGATTSSTALRRVYQEDEDFVRHIEADSTIHMLRQDIYGKNIFNRKNLSFAPDVNIPTPANYKLAAGDEVVIEIWGASQASFRRVISPEGSINIDNLGPITLSGMTVETANTYVKNKLASLYSGVNDMDGTSHIKLTLGQIRTIQINVMGEVAVPGTYSISSLSSIFHALYLAGGINDIGSLREISLVRKGNKIETVDIYDFLLYGKTTDTRLFDGDVIMVPPYKSLVNIRGQVKRPMFYEMTEKETVDNLIKYAGGFTGGAYADKISLVRKTGGYDKIFTLNEAQRAAFNVADGDSISIDGGLALYDNRVQITGNVFRPGYYEIGGDIKTVKDLVIKAGNPKENAFLDRVILTREKEDLTLETLALNLNNILSGASPDIALRKNDILLIASNRIEEDLGDLAIFGLVAEPGTYDFAYNTTIKDLILKAGGLLSSASTARVDVSRRIIDPTSTTTNTIIAETFTFSIEDGLVADGKDGFVLKPYDQVYVRRSPGYEAQRNVMLEGEVIFPGEYTLEVKEQRISDLVKQAGGTTPHAFLDGARLVRQQSKEERLRQLQSINMLQRGNKEDSLSVESLDTASEYTIGIDLKKALSNPKSNFDIVLKPGDRLFIPEFDNTVKINGAVMFPNTVLYQKGMTLQDYVNQAGGFSDLAQKKRVYIVYMNGMTAKAKGSSKSLLKPGCEIVVPTKEVKPKMSTGEIIGITSGVVSMASVIALLINSF